MTVEFMSPFNKAWNHMVQHLFKPFRAHVWFGIGFSAFLAQQASRGGGSGGHHGPSGADDFHVDQLFSFPQTAWEWLAGHPGYSILIGFGVFILIALCALFLWISSRGKFMFVHNVALKNSEVKKPWEAYHEQAHSLFVWRLWFTIISLLLVIFNLATLFIFAREIYYTGFHIHNLVTSIGLAIWNFVIFFILGSIGLFLDDFIVPIMVKQKGIISEAWSAFLPILKSRLGSFIVYVLFISLLRIIFMAAVVMVGLFTCCIGFFFLAIPYIGTVVTLPAHYLFRAYSLEFLAQFGEEYQILDIGIIS